MNQLISIKRLRYSWAYPFDTQQLCSAQLIADKITLNQVWARKQLRPSF
ncbi:hypothetical protein [Endozoicomonas sp. GU-1]|nr:hypothetical protein [Endozoicomonas sp. GU-1]WBA80104.1 hypothetical protein O2T12_17340 [Endozoicomonas sp. GU-1]